MATYVPGGADLFDAYGGGLPDQESVAWLQQQQEKLYQTIPQTVSNFFQKSRDYFQVLSNTQAAQMMRNLRNKVEGIWSYNDVIPLLTLEQIQTASPIMQRYVMAQPDLRRRYLNQEVDGYSDTYVNHQGDTIGAAQYDYRQVMSGILELGAGEHDDWVVNYYFEPMEAGEKELTLNQKVDVLRTWEHVKVLLEEGGEDPTSLYGNHL